MFRKVFALLVASVIVTAFSPVQGAIAADCEWGPWEGCRLGDRGNPIDPRELEGKYVKVLSYIGQWAGEGDQLIRVEVEGKALWTKAGIGIDYNPAVVENGVTEREYLYDPPYSLFFHGYYGNLPEDFQGIWMVNPEYPPYEFIDVYEVYEPTVKDQRIDALWSEFLKATPKELHAQLWDTSPYARAYSMYTGFWYSGWTVARYREIHQLSHRGANAPKDGRYYEAIYGMDGWLSLPDDGKGLAVVSFIKQPENSVVMGQLCSPKYFFRGYEFDRVERANTDDKVWIGEFNITMPAAAVAVFTHDGREYKLRLLDTSNFIAVVPGELFPNWGEFQGQSVMPTLEIWSLCNK